MIGLGVPSVACVIGEGGSGGAVAIAVTDRVLMQENAIYSVISPEGCAAILWRDASEAKKAAAAFKPDARHCLDLGVIDGIVPEPRRRRPRGLRRGGNASRRGPRRVARRRRGRRIRRTAACPTGRVSAPWASSSADDSCRHRYPQDPQAFPQPESRVFTKNRRNRSKPARHQAAPAGRLPTCVQKRSGPVQDTGPAANPPWSAARAKPICSAARAG